jgi:hypothetical protein
VWMGWLRACDAVTFVMHTLWDAAQAACACREARLLWAGMAMCEGAMWPSTCLYTMQGGSPRRSKAGQVGAILAAPDT